MGKLQGKVAVVTGGTTGIGFATAKRFVDEGAFVFITGRRQKELDEAVQAIGTNVVGVRGDVSKLQDLDRLYEAVKAKGKIDVLIANAGIGEFAPLASLTEEHFDKLFDLNVKGTLFTVQKALTLMNDGGRSFSSAPSRASKAHLPSVPTARPKRQFAIWREPGPWS
jgi:NAD(P)-dependent dehydrogenase (short-subunit alcohol dehydrogenase family)